MATIEILSKTPKVKALVVDNYDFAMQQLFGGSTPAAWQTGNSLQTFDHNGRPMDAKADDND